MDSPSHQPPADIRLSFDRVTEIYDRVRPGYPKALIDAIFAALPAVPRILEVGAGTGKATVSLLEAGGRVTAVELGPQLAAFLRRRFVDQPHLTVVNAGFEDGDFALRSFDAVVSATAYHWVEERAQIERPMALLRPGGVLGILDMIQVDSPVDGGYYDRVQPIYERFGSARSSWEPRSYGDVVPRIAERLEASGRYESVEVHRERWDQTYTSAEYRDLLFTHSGTQMLPEPERTEMVDQLVAVIDDEHAGSLTRPLVATLTLAKT